MNTWNILLILVGSWLLSWMVNFLFKQVVPKLVKKTKSDTDDRIVAAIRLPTTITIVAGAIILILSPYSEQMVWVRYLNNGFLSLLVIFWSFAITQVVDAILDEANHRVKSHHDIFPFFKSLNRIGIFGLCLILILMVWKIDITPLLAAGGVAGVAVAFAARDTIANIFGGISVFIDKPYRVGDYIVIDNTERGEVVLIGARTTKIKTRDDVMISIPNSVMSTSKIVNETGLNPPLRIRVMVGLPYTCDLEKAEKTLFLAISSVDKISDNPAPRIRFREFADSSIKAEVMGWVEMPAEKGMVRHALIKRIHKDLRKAQITIPFPQRDVYVRKIKNQN